MIPQDVTPAPPNVGGTGTSLGQMGRARGGREGDTGLEVWHSRHAQSGGPSFSARFYQAESGGRNRDGCDYQQETADAGLARAWSGGGFAAEICLKRIYNSRFKWKCEGGGRFISSIRTLRQDSDYQYNARGIFSVTPSWRSFDFDGPFIGIQPLQASSRYEEILYRVCAICRWDSEVFPIYCPSFWMVPLWLLVLSISRKVLDDGEDRVVLPCVIICGRFRYCSVNGTGIFSGELQAGFGETRSLTPTVRFDEAPQQRSLGIRQSDYPTLGFYDRYSPRNVRCPRGKSAQDQSTGQKATMPWTEKSPPRPEKGVGLLPWQGSELTVGHPRYGLQAPSALRLPIVKLFGPFRRVQFWPPQAVGVTRAVNTFSSSDERPAVLEQDREGHDVPPNLGTGTTTDNDHPHRRVINGIRSHVSQGPVDRWREGLFRGPRILESFVPGVGAYHYPRTDDSQTFARGIYGTLRNSTRRDNSSVYRPSSGFKSGYRYVFQVPQANGRATPSSSVFEGSRNMFTHGISPVCTEPIRGQVIPSTEVQRLPTKTSTHPRTLVGRRERARFQVVLDEREISSPSIGTLTPRSSQNQARRISGAAIGTPVAQAKLAPRPGGARSEDANASGEPSSIPQTLGGNPVSVRTRQRSGNGSDSITAQIANRLRATAPADSRGIGCRLEEGANLIVAGYSDSRLSSQSSSMKRFVDFCESEGVAWDTASRHVMVAFLADLYATTKISGETATQYVSAVNTAYLKMGLDPPGRAANAERLFFDVKKSLEGFKRLRAKSDPLRGQPTPSTTPQVIHALCVLVSNFLDRKILPSVRDGLANIFQYYMFSRPTMTAMMKWEQIEFISASEISVTIPRLAVGRKNKDMPSKLVVRSIDSSVDPKLHPITLLYRYRALVDANRRQFQRRFPIGIWELPSRARASGPNFNSADMGTWLTASTAQIDQSLMSRIRITPRSHRSGAATAALKLRVDDAQICHVADWELTGKTLRSTYYRPNLSCPLPLANFFFADLL